MGSGDLTAKETIGFVFAGGIFQRIFFAKRVIRHFIHVENSSQIGVTIE
jgi:hypothetical protein